MSFAVVNLLIEISCPNVAYLPQDDSELSQNQNNIAIPLHHHCKVVRFDVRVSSRFIVANGGNEGKRSLSGLARCSSHDDPVHFTKTANQVICLKTFK